MNDTFARRVVLVAEDDPDDRGMIAEALKECAPDAEVRFVHDGQGLLDYLNRDGEFADERTNPLPTLVLLDLNMPRLTGREALREIKLHPSHRRIPIVVFSGAEDESIVTEAYEIGGNSFVRKPLDAAELARSLRTITAYWFNVVQLPQDSMN